VEYILTLPLQYIQPLLLQYAQSKLAFSTQMVPLPFSDFYHADWVL
jgi:hypothetical protein